MPGVLACIWQDQDLKQYYLTAELTFLILERKGLTKAELYQGRWNVGIIIEFYKGINLVNI